MVEPPIMPTPKVPEAERRPKGWQLRSEYLAPDGTLYRRGRLVDAKSTEDVRSVPEATPRSTKRSAVTKRSTARAPKSKPAGRVKRKRG